MSPWQRAGQVIMATAITALICYIIILALWMLLQPFSL